MLNSESDLARLTYQTAKSRKIRSHDSSPSPKYEGVLVTNVTARVGRSIEVFNGLKRRRDREPSRLPKRKLYRILRHRQKRKKIKHALNTEFPRSSDIHCLYVTLKSWSSGFLYESLFISYWLAAKLRTGKNSTRRQQFANGKSYSNCLLYKDCCKTHTFESLAGGMDPGDKNDIDIEDSYRRLTSRLFDKGLQPLDCGSSGECFFKSVSHQYYGTPEFYHQIRQAGVQYLKHHPELFIETLTTESWDSYVNRMGTPGTWCDHNIIQAVANQLNCVIHIIESRVSKPEGTTVSPPPSTFKPFLLFVGYIENFHYISAVPHSSNKNALKYLKQKLSETPQERKKRLQCQSEKYKQRKRTQEQSSCTTKKACKISQKEYLNNFDVENYGDIHEQDWAKANIKKFHISNEYVIFQCKICFEAWPLRSVPKDVQNYRCSRCTREKEFPSKFSKENFMIPSPVPDVLCGLTQVEEMLIARALPIMHIYVKPGGQRGYSGHIVNLPQDVRELASLLPRYPKDISIIIIRAKGKGGSFKNLSVRRQVVSNALNWLIQNNPHYADVHVNLCALNSLPENDVPQEILSIETDECSIMDNLKCSPDRGPRESEDDIVYDCYTDSSSLLPTNSNQQQEVDFIHRQVLQGQADWPTLENNPLNEYVTPFLATMAFPTLFPDGKGDPTNPAIIRNVTLSDKIKHLIKFAEQKNNGWMYRFANHPRFSYWALNMIHRKQILQQTGIFLKQNPGENHLSMEELREMVTNNEGNLVMTKLSRYICNITGSDAYWHKAKEDLKAIIQHVGPPTFFFTFSSADMHWPDLHTLIKNQPGDETTPEMRRQNVIDNPHIVDWFFTERLKKFVKHWLYDSLDAKWHWYRFEYQSRGSIHCHGVAKLSNDPGLCKLSEIALEGYLVKSSNTGNSDSKTEEDGKAAADKICQYVDWLLCTCNPESPDNGLWMKPSVHPCQKYYVNIQDSESDYVDLLNMVQRHTRCSTSYCLRRKQNEIEPKCRFNFPLQQCDKTSLQFQKINTRDNTSKYKVEIITKRNDTRVNNHQRLQLQGWRANCDIQVVVDYHALIKVFLIIISLSY